MDRAEVEETDIAELEAEIDGAVYDLFDLTAEERAVVEEYLEMFCSGLDLPLSLKFCDQSTPFNQTVEFSLFLC